MLLACAVDVLGALGYCFSGFGAFAGFLRAGIVGLDAQGQGRGGTGEGDLGRPGSFTHRARLLVTRSNTCRYALK